MALARFETVWPSRMNFIVFLLSNAICRMEDPAAVCYTDATRRTDTWNENTARSISARTNTALLWMRSSVSRTSLSSRDAMPTLWTRWFCFWWMQNSNGSVPDNYIRQATQFWKERLCGFFHTQAHYIAVQFSGRLNLRGNSHAENLVRSLYFPVPTLHSLNLSTEMSINPIGSSCRNMTM